MGDERPAFDDGDELRPASSDVSDAELAATVASLVRADLTGASVGAVMRSFEAGSAEEQRRFAFAWGDAMRIDGLGDWIAAEDERRARAETMAQQIAPFDPGPGESAVALDALAAFSTWSAHAYPLIIVPGYTPVSLVAPIPGVHPIARRRLDRAAADFRAGMAPFILVSGGAVYPRGTPYAEGIEMKRELLAMGLPEDRILVDARARHSTTNLRNAGRMMLDHGMTRAVIVTLGGGLFGSDLFGQDFYFAHPVLSTFHARCERELGYRVGELEAAGEEHITFVPAADVRRVGFRDALDP
ncbi:Hypothetical protein A7982_01612 [Minicystis rosea]|nr:Hypothetical protein A7982_01612 [Minicystis rosea]